MEVNVNKPNAEAAGNAVSAVQNTRFKEKRLIEAQTDNRDKVVYFSPVIKIDSETNTAILQYRDSETGKVKNEFPAKQASDSYEQVQTQRKDIPVESAKKAEHEDETV